MPHVPPHHHHHHHECCKNCGCPKLNVCEHCRTENQIDAITSAQDLYGALEGKENKNYTFEAPMSGDKRKPNVPTVVGNVSVDLALCWDPTCKHKTKQNKELVGGSIAKNMPFPLDFDVNIDPPSIQDFVKPYPKVDQAYDEESVGCETCQFSESTETAGPTNTAIKERVDAKFEPYRHLYNCPPRYREDVKDEESLATLKATEDAATETKDTNLVDTSTSPDYAQEEDEEEEPIMVIEVPTEEKSMQVNIDEEERKAKELIDSEKPQKSPLKKMLCCGSKQGSK